MLSLLVTALVSLLFVGVVEAAPQLARHAGRVHSLIPHARVLIIEEWGAGGAERVIEVHVRDAEVVKVGRDPKRPWEWRERPTRLRRLPVGTFVVVIGRQVAPGVVEADRVEVPSMSGSATPERP